MKTMKMSRRGWAAAAVGATLMAALGLQGCGSDARSTTLADAEAAYLEGLKTTASSIAEAPAALPTSKQGYNELQYMIQLGEDLIRNTNTHALTAPYVPQSDLTCSSCHRDAGQKKAIASTFIGTAASFPAYNDRDKGIVTLQDRINSCFMRSMNGVRLPADSEALLAMTAYITWLSEGTPIKMNADRAVSGNNNAFVNKEIQALHNAGAANTVNGQVQYEARCAGCHGLDGLGADSDADGHFEFPPVWGPGSYNKGAGLASDFKGASWIQFNMPPAEEFSLSNQDALDIMAYLNAQSRPAFVEEDHLPLGGFAAYDDTLASYHYGRSYPDKSARVPVESAPVAEAPDGATLYAANCASCHGALATSAKRGATAARIQGAMDAVASMGSLGLSAEQVSAIAGALNQ